MPGAISACVLLLDSDLLLKSVLIKLRDKIRKLQGITVGAYLLKM